MNAQLEPEAPEPEEPENPDAEPDPDDPEEPEEPEQPAEPEEPSSLSVIIDRDKKLTAETRRHEKALERIYGDNWPELQPCPLCLTDGYVIPAPPGVFPDEQWTAVEMAAGKDQGAIYEPDPETDICPTCKGWGKLDTGAHTGEIAIRICRTCTGNGWVTKQVPLAPVAQWQPPAPFVSTNRLPGQDNNEYDAWGRPAGHERFGIAIEFTGGTW